jgi:hypothetical protein
MEMCNTSVKLPKHSKETLSIQKDPGKGEWMVQCVMKYFYRIRAFCLFSSNQATRILLQGIENLLPESNGVEFILHGSVKPHICRFSFSISKQINIDTPSNGSINKFGAGVAA